MFMDWRYIHHKILLCICLALCLFGCEHKDGKKELLTDYYDELDISMKNVLDESVQQEYDGEFYQIKIKYAFKYEYNNNDVIIYKLLIIPKYLTKTVVKGIQLHSIEYDSVLDYLYDEMNFAFSNLDASKHTYQKVDEFVGKYYEFALVNNSKIKGKELTDDQWESALTNISLTIKINRTNDIINMKDINIVPYDSSIHD